MRRRPRFEEGLRAILVSSGRNPDDPSEKSDLPERVIRYSEKLIEGFIRDHPALFLGENLKLVNQQQEIDGYRPDLVFRDDIEQIVIVEIQIEALDRAHIYRVLEYRDSYTTLYNQKARALVFCNSVQQKHRRLLSLHNIECVEKSKEEVIQLINKLSPTTRILATPPQKPKPPLTAASIVKAVTDLASPISISEAEKVIYFDFKDFRSKDDTKYNYSDLETWSETAPWWGEGERRRQESKPVPLAFIFDARPLLTLDSEKCRRIMSVLEYILKYSRPKIFNTNLVLGWRSHPDRLSFESHIHNRISLYQPIHRQYVKESEDWRDRSFDDEKINDDLQFLLSIAVWIKDQNDFVKCSLLSSYRVVEGPEPLLSSWENIKNIWRYERRESPGEIEKIIAREEVNLRLSTWRTIYFDEIIDDLIRPFLSLLQQIAEGTFVLRKEKFSYQSKWRNSAFPFVPYFRLSAELEKKMLDHFTFVTTAEIALARQQVRTE